MSWIWNSVDFVSDRHFHIIANGFSGELHLIWDQINNKWVGTVFGDQVSNIWLAQNFIQFTRNGNGFTQVYSGSLVVTQRSDNNSPNDSVTLMGSFTHDGAGSYWWTSEPEEIVVSFQ
jgi:hypothetical protein